MDSRADRPHGIVAAPSSRSGAWWWRSSSEDPPRHVVEEFGVEELAHAEAPDSIFSLVAAEGGVSVGSTFLAEEPDPVAWIPQDTAARAALRARARPGPRAGHPGVRSAGVAGRPAARGAARDRGAVGGGRARAVGHIGRAGHRAPGGRRDTGPGDRAGRAGGRALLGDRDWDPFHLRWCLRRVARYSAVMGLRDRRQR